MFPIAGSILIALAEASPDKPTDFDLFIRSFKQHFADQRALLPLLGIGLLVGVVVLLDILIGLRLAKRTGNHAGTNHPSSHQHDAPPHHAATAQPGHSPAKPHEPTHSMLDPSRLP